MSLFDSVFGAGAQQAVFGSVNSQYDDALDASRSAQLQAQYSRAQQARFNTHKWVYNGRPCSLHEFADSVWGKEEHEDKMLFLLTHSGPPPAESSR